MEHMSYFSGGDMGGAPALYAYGIHGAPPKLPYNFQQWIKKRKRKMRKKKKEKRGRGRRKRKMNPPKSKF